MNRIGNRLVARGLVEPGALDDALERQKVEGGYLGELLLDAGALSRQALHHGLAEQWGMVWRDLDREPPDPVLLARTEIDRCLELGWLPCEVTDDAVVVATTVQPGPDLLLEIEEEFPGLSVRLVACTRRDLDHVAAGVRRRGASHVPRVATRQRRWLRPCARTGVLAVGLVYLVTSALVVPPGLLSSLVALTGAVFLAAVMVQCGAAIRAARTAVLVASDRDVDEAGGPGPGGAGDLLLPVYSVVVVVPDDETVLARTLADLATLDYPRFRLDVVLVVPDSGQEAVRRSAPPDWVRVVPVPQEVAADRVRAFDEGLAYARGRYVVAYDVDDVPVPAQLRQAVAVFESDLEACLAGRQRHPVLMRLDVTDHVWRHRHSLASLADRFESVLGLDRAQPSDRERSDTRSEWTSSHFNTRVLRRLGGWSAMTPGSAVARSLPTGLLHSTTSHRRPHGLLAAFRRRVLVAGGLLDAAAARVVLAVRAPAEGAARPRSGAIVLGLAGPALLLAHPLALVAATAFVVRAGEMDAATAWAGAGGVVALVVGQAVAVSTAARLVAPRHGRRAAVQAVALPVLGVVASVAAWHALLVALSSRRAGWSGSPTA